MMRSVLAVGGRLWVVALLVVAPMLVGAAGEPEEFRGGAPPPHGCACAPSTNATGTPVVQLRIEGGGSVALGGNRWIRDSICYGGGPGGTCFASEGSSCYLSVYFNQTSGEWEMGCTG